MKRALLGLALVSLTTAFGCSRSQAAPRSDNPGVAPADAPSPPSAPEGPSGPAAGVAGKESGATGGTGKPFGAPCVDDSECAANACFHKRIHQPDATRERRGSTDPVEASGYCSLRCEDDKDCPVPPSSGRCGGRGMCKR